MKNILSLIIFTFSFILSLVDSTHTFQFNDKEEFTILQFTDFHYGENDDKDAKTLALQRKILNLVNPDLAIVSGDAVGGYSGYLFHLFTNYGFFKKYWKTFTTPFVEANVPYAYTFGNHDAEAELTRKEIVELDKTHPLSILKTAEGISGTANYMIPIYSSRNKNKLAANIWVFDSGSLGCSEFEDSWGCIEKEQIEWYNTQSNLLKLQHGNDVHHVAFYHIPIPEYMHLFNEEQIAGISLDFIGCPYHNTGFFDSVLKNGDITGMFVGHDHSNDFTGWYKGVEFVYGRKSGYGSYGEIFGARVIKFKEVEENGKIIIKREHYVIEENGSIKITPVTEFRKGEKQSQCPSIDEHIFIKLRGTGLYDGIGILLVLVMIATMIVFLQRKFCQEHRKGEPKRQIEMAELENSAYNPSEDNEDSDEITPSEP